MTSKAKFVIYGFVNFPVVVIPGRNLTEVDGMFCCPPLLAYASGIVTNQIAFKITIKWSRSLKK